MFSISPLSVVSPVHTLPYLSQALNNPLLVTDTMKY